MHETATILNKRTHGWYPTAALAGIFFQLVFILVLVLCCNGYGLRILQQKDDGILPWPT
jgi:hypothetical protein